MESGHTFLCFYFGTHPLRFQVSWVLGEKIVVLLKMAILNFLLLTSSPHFTYESALSLWILIFQTLMKPKKGMSHWGETFTLSSQICQIPTLRSTLLSELVSGKSTAVWHKRNRTHRQLQYFEKSMEKVERLDQGQRRKLS